MKSIAHCPNGMTPCKKCILLSPSRRVIYKLICTEAENIEQFVFFSRIT